MILLSHLVNVDFFDSTQNAMWNLSLYRGQWIPHYFTFLNICTCLNRAVCKSILREPLGFSVQHVRVGCGISKFTFQLSHKSHRRIDPFSLFQNITYLILYCWESSWDPENVFFRATVTQPRPKPISYKPNFITCQTPQAPTADQKPRNFVLLLLPPNNTDSSELFKDKMEKVSIGMAIIQEGPGDLLELNLISRLWRSAPTNKMAALASRLYGSITCKGNFPKPCSQQVSFLNLQPKGTIYVALSLLGRMAG